LDQWNFDIAEYCRLFWYKTDLKPFIYSICECVFNRPFHKFIRSTCYQKVHKTEPRPIHINSATCSFLQTKLSLTIHSYVYAAFRRKAIIFMQFKYDFKIMNLIYCFIFWQ
jgi:hypothetical protein